MILGDFHKIYHILVQKTYKFRVYIYSEFIGFLGGAPGARNHRIFQYFHDLLVILGISGSPHQNIANMIGLIKVFWPIFLARDAKNTKFSDLRGFL